MIMDRCTGEDRRSWRGHQYRNTIDESVEDFESIGYYYKYVRTKWPI